MFEGLLLPWQQIYHLAFYSILEQLLKFLVNFTLLKYVKSQGSCGFLITKELIFGFQILDLKDHFSASLIPGVPRKYISLKSKIFVLRSDQSVKLTSFVRQVLNLDFDT